MFNNYHVASALQQERLNRYQAELGRAVARRNSSQRLDLSQAVSRALGYGVRRGVVRPAI